MTIQQNKIAELRENFPFLFWAAGLAAVLVITLAMVAFYYTKTLRATKQVQSRFSEITHLADSLARRLERTGQQHADMDALKRLRLLAAADTGTLHLAESVYEQASQNIPNEQTRIRLADILENLHDAADRAALVHNQEYEKKHALLIAVIIALTVIILVVISFFTGISRGELKNRYKAYRREQELNTLKSHFVAVASHEFRTPLSTIQLCASLMERYADLGDRENVHQQSLKIKVIIANLTAMLEDLLSLEKLETGKILPTYQIFSLPGLCAEIMEEMKVIGCPDQELLYTACGVEETVNLDKNLFRNAVANLMSNAIKYAGSHARIQLRSQVSVTGIKVSVRDNGQGIPQHLQKDLFTPFFRVDPNTSVPGSGLGLNIVKKYAEMMNGKVDFYSMPGKETCFTLSFPIHAETVI